jgi:hypothetical protein
MTPIILDEPSLLELQFKKVYFKTVGQIVTTYYKQGLYLESIRCGVYIVFDRRMNIIGVISNINELQVLYIAKAYPLCLN